MPFETLLVHVDDCSGSAGLLKAAVDLALGWSSKLIGLGGCVPPYAEPAFASNIDGYLLQAMCDEEQRQLAVCEAAFKDFAGPLGDNAVWLSEREDANQALEGCAASADLIIASPQAAPSGRRLDLSRIALRAGIPVLILPASLAELHCRRIVVGWANTREARRAVTDALPLLQAAQEVRLVEVCQNGSTARVEASLNDVAGRLEQHGVAATTQAVPSASADIVEDLLAHAAQHGADLIVSGAYGHSRLMEWSLGGMTEGLLLQTALPVFFSH